MKPTISLLVLLFTLITSPTGFADDLPACKNKAIATKHSVQRDCYRQRIERFISKFREGTAQDYGWKDMVSEMYDKQKEPPGMVISDEPLLSNKTKRHEVQKAIRNAKPPLLIEEALCLDSIYKQHTYEVSYKSTRIGKYVPYRLVELFQKPNMSDPAQADPKELQEYDALKASLNKALRKAVKSCTVQGSAAPQQHGSRHYHGIDSVPVQSPR